MKNVKQSLAIILLAIALCFSDSLFAQNSAKVDANGNYIALTVSTKEPAKNTGKTFTDSKGTVYPVMLSASGKLFYNRTSKKGLEYRVYIKVQSN